jgi:hypothetical protein
VGRCSASAQRRRRPSSALAEPVGVARLHPAPAQGLGEHRVRGDELAAHDVEDVVDDADHHGDEGLELGAQGVLLG